MTDARGRWFRVYARQIRQHDKFRHLTGLELGAWLTLRVEAELRDAAVIADRDEAVLILRRRKVSRAGSVMDRLVELHLFDIAADGSIAVHDRADHDRPTYPSDEAEAVAERKRLSRMVSRDESRVVTTRDINGHDTHAGVQPQQADSAPANSTQPTAPAAGLPADDDSATAACRMFLDGGKWLGDPEYVKGWEEMDRRYTPAWVQEEMPAAYAELLARGGKVRPWDLKRTTDLRCAERSRSEEKGRQKASEQRQQDEMDELAGKRAALTAEEKERQDLMRRAIRTWKESGMVGDVPTDLNELRGWLESRGAA